MSQSFAAILSNYSYNDIGRLSFRVRAAVAYMVYKKLFKCAVLNPKEHSEANIINYIQVDTQKLEEGIAKLNTLYEASWQIFYGFTISLYLVGVKVIIPSFIVFFMMTSCTIAAFKQVFKHEVRF